MKTGYKVIDAMTTKPITVPESTSVRACAKIMKEHNIGSLLIVSKSALTGIIISDDIIFNAASEGFDFDKTLIKDIMITDIVSITPEKDIFDALMLMKENDIKHLPVLDDRGKLAGFLTYKDILKIQPQLFEIIAEKFMLREEYRKPIFDFVAEDFQ